MGAPPSLSLCCTLVIWTSDSLYLRKSTVLPAVRTAAQRRDLVVAVGRAREEELR